MRSVSALLVCEVNVPGTASKALLHVDLFTFRRLSERGHSHRRSLYALRLSDIKKLTGQLNKVTVCFRRCCCPAHTLKFCEEWLLEELPEEASAESDAVE